MKRMGNSSTSRYADGRELYHPDATGTLRSLAARRALASDLRETSQALARNRLRSRNWQRLRASLRRVAPPQAMGARRGAGEAARLLLDPATGPELRRLARRHRLDEGDVASLWAALLYAPAAQDLGDFAAEAAAT